MAIADCGFPPFIIVPGSNPPQVMLARDQLLIKGPTIAVEIGFKDELFHPDPVKVQEAINEIIGTPPQSSKLVDALIDTGAGESCIDEELAKVLQLPKVDQVPGCGVSGKDVFNLYLGYIRIPSLNHVQWGRFMGARLSDGGQPHQALLGRGLFKSMLLVYDGRDGTCRLSV